jgi:O-methyltransferase
VRAILAAFSDETRKVWLFDSFAGLPKPDVKNYPQDEPTGFGHSMNISE